MGEQIFKAEIKERMEQEIGLVALGLINAHCMTLNGLGGNVLMIFNSLPVELQMKFDFPDSKLGAIAFKGITQVCKGKWKVNSPMREGELEVIFTPDEEWLKKMGKWLQKQLE